jgi:Host cell surface-exposed lipoprotein
VRRRHRIVLWFVVMMIGTAVGALAGCGGSADDGASAPRTVTVVETVEADAETAAPEEEAEEEAPSDETAGQENARQSAESYLETTSFSRSGLIEQLKFEGYTQQQAVYGVNQAGL